MIDNVTGYITPELIKAGGKAWAATWLKIAQDAARIGNELIVIEVKPDEPTLFDNTEHPLQFDEPFI